MAANISFFVILSKFEYLNYVFPVIRNKINISPAFRNNIGIFPANGNYVKHNTTCSAAQPACAKLAASRIALRAGTSSIRMD